MLSERRLNLRGLVSADEGRAAIRRCDCDGYRPDTLGGGIASALPPAGRFTDRREAAR